MRRLLPLLLLCALLAPPPPARGQDAAAVHGGPVRALATLPQGGLASAGFDQAVILWDHGTGRARAVLRWHGGAVNALAVLRDGRLASAGEDARIALWNPAAPGASPLAVREGHAGPVAALAASSDGRLASAGWDGTVRLWPPEDAPARILRGHQGPVTGIGFLADGALASAGFDGTVLLWTAAETPRVLGRFGVPQNALIPLPQGGIALGGADGVVRLIAADGGVQELTAGTRPIVALAVPREGGMLAAASLGGHVALWDLPAGRLRHVLDGPGLPVWSAAFDADGRTLWTGGADRQVRRWDAEAGRPLGPLATAAEAALPEGADPHGARVWRACAACHALTEAAGPMAGPHLHGLFGRRMGSVAGYAYSERLARGDIVWTPETVADLFTRGPDVVTPGTRMPIQTVGNAEDLAALLRFLHAATR
jgi:cytochrome c